MVPSPDPPSTAPASPEPPGDLAGLCRAHHFLASPWLCKPGRRRLSRNLGGCLRPPIWAHPVQVNNKNILFRNHNNNITPTKSGIIDYFLTQSLYSIFSKVPSMAFGKILGSYEGSRAPASRLRGRREGEREAWTARAPGTDTKGPF